MITITLQITLALVSIYVPAWGGINADVDPGHTATMDIPRVGIAACDPSVLYEWFCLDHHPDGFPECYQCLDVGPAIHSNYIDLCYVPDRRNAREFVFGWGRRQSPIRWVGARPELGLRKVLRQDWPDKICVDNSERCLVEDKG